MDHLKPPITKKVKASYRAQSPTRNELTIAAEYDGTGCAELEEDSRALLVKAAFYAQYIRSSDQFPDGGREFPAVLRNPVAIDSEYFGMFEFVLNLPRSDMELVQRDRFRGTERYCRLM
jgi:hypothetical protein